MSDVGSNASAKTTRVWVALDVHKNGITAGVLPAEGGQLELVQFDNGEKAIRRLIRRVGGPAGLAVCYEAGPCGYDPYRLFVSMGVACDIVAPSLIAVRPGDRVKTDRRDARKLVRLDRAGELSFVRPPTPEQERLRELVRCRDDLRRARTAARQRVGKRLLRYGRISREGKSAWTLQHRAWVRRQRLDDPLAQASLEHMLCPLEALEARLASLDRQLAGIAASDPCSDAVAWLCCLRGISTLTALALLAEIGDFRRFANARELISFLGLTVAESSSGDRRLRGSLTKTGNRHARRLLVEAARHDQHPPRLSARLQATQPLVPPDARARAWQAQIRLHQRHRHLTGNGKLPTVATAAVAPEPCGFIWATMTRQPLRNHHQPLRARASKEAVAA